MTPADVRHPGACDDCTAYAKIHTEGQVTLVRIFHDDSCPHYTARLNRAERRRANRKNGENK